MGKNVCPNCQSEDIERIEEINPTKNGFEEWEKTYNPDGTLKQKPKKKGLLAKIFKRKGH